MQMSQGGLDNLLKKFEGCKLKAYKCPAGILTIGYGHTSAAGSPEVTEGMTITQSEAETILKNDMGKYEQPVIAMVKVPLEQRQFDVLVDFAYNAGVGALKSSTLLKKVNANDFDAVPEELLKWTKGKIPGKGMQVLPGLLRRRQAESAWWTTNHDHPDDHQDHRAEPVSPPQKTMIQSKQGNAAVVTGALGTLGAAKEVAAQAQDASDTVEQLMGLLHNTNFLIMIVIGGLGAAIWYWRKQNMDKNGV
jgi:lysozyme